MKKIHQFWTLTKFEIYAITGIYCFPLIFLIPLISTHTAVLRDSVELSLYLQVGETLFIIMAFMLAPQLLAPELSFIRSEMITRESGTEFLLTRAVDRTLILRVRSLLYYAVVLIIPLSLLFWSLTNPRLDLKESDAKIYQMMLHQVPGSTQVQRVSGVDVSGHRITQSDRKELISIPYGKVMIASWRLWLLAFTIVCTQIFIFLICQFRFQKILYYGVGYGLIFLPIPLMIFTDKMNFEFHSSLLSEIAFIHFAGHQLLCWLIAIAAMILGQLWCEKRFSRMEQ